MTAVDTEVRDDKRIPRVFRVTCSQTCGQTHTVHAEEVPAIDCLAKRAASTSERPKHLPSRAGLVRPQH